MNKPCPYCGQRDRTRNRMGNLMQHCGNSSCRRQYNAEKAALHRAKTTGESLDAIRARYRVAVAGPEGHVDEPELPPTAEEVRALSEAYHEPFMTELFDHTDEDYADERWRGRMVEHILTLIAAGRGPAFPDRIPARWRGLVP